MNPENSKIEMIRNPEDGSLRVCISGALHFGLRKDFLTNLEKIKDPIKSCVVDFTKTTHIDSTAIGMLVMLKNNEYLTDAEFKLQTHRNKTIIEILKSHCLFDLFDEIA